MCGDLDEEDVRLQEFYNRFVYHTHAKLKSTEGSGKPTEPEEDANVLTAHLDDMFRRILLAATDPAKAPPEIEGYQRLSMEPLVLARIAGFMAAHLPLYEDPLRRVIEALMLGYSEGEIALPDHDHHHGHDHDHGHGHAHGHGHGHGHTH